MKSLSIVLAAFLIFSFIPFASFAQEYPAVEDPAAERADDRDPISEDIINEDNPEELIFDKFEEAVFAERGHTASAKAKSAHHGNNG